MNLARSGGIIIVYSLYSWDYSGFIVSPQLLKVLPVSFAKLIYKVLKAAKCFVNKWNKTLLFKNKSF